MTFERWIVVISFAINVVWFLYALVNQRWTRHRVSGMEAKLDMVLFPEKHKQYTAKELSYPANRSEALVRAGMLEEEAGVKCWWCQKLKKDHYLSKGKYYCSCDTVQVLEYTVGPVANA